MSNTWLRHAVTLVGVGGLVVAFWAAPAGATPAKQRSSGPVVVVSGLNNPRQLSLVDGVELLVAEAGKGGPTETSGPEGSFFIGASGSVSAVWFPQRAHGQSPHRIVTGLASGAEAPDGSFAVGSDGVSARGVGAPVYIQETVFPPEALPLANHQQNGKLLKLRHGSLSAVADITGFEHANDPDRQGVVSNPYAVLVVPGGELVADAAANDVLFVDMRGHIHVFHVFPNVTSGACAGQNDPSPAFPGCNFVPTSLATDRWGNVYVGGLSSLTPGEAQVVKLDPRGHVLRAWGGFTAVSGLAVGPDGSLYVSQLFAGEAAPVAPGAQGVLTKISRTGDRTDMDVPFPAGLAVDRDNNVYVSALSIAPEQGLGVPGVDSSGQIWRVRF
jgi:hypothetical protein